jgi:hypothetical protein
MYNAELVRKLRKEIAAEKDPRIEEELCILLIAVLRENNEEVRIRMALLSKICDLSRLLGTSS